MTYNYSDVSERNIIVGVMHTLHKSIALVNYRKKVQEKHMIPFFYSFSGQEDFLYDHFMKPLFDNEEKAEGHYEKIPRGIITLTSSGIDTEMKTNPGVYGSFYKGDKEDVVREYVAKYQPIPIKMSFDCRVIVSGNLDMLKISEQIKKHLYRNLYFTVDINRVPVPGVITLPTDYTKNRLLEYSFEEKKYFNVDFAFDVRSFIPDFNEDTEIFAGNRMQRGIVHNVVMQSENTVNEFKTRLTEENK